MQAISNLDINAKLMLNDKSFYLSKSEVQALLESINFSEDETHNTSEKMCYVVFHGLDSKFNEDLSENNKKKLAASILQINYFQFSDILFKANKTFSGNTRIRTAPKFALKKKIKLTIEQERNRLDTEARTGQKITKEEYTEYVRSNQKRKKEKETFRNKPIKLVQAYAKCVAEYKLTAMDSLEIIPINEGQNLPFTNGIKLGGLAKMLPNESYPVDSNNNPMQLICEIDLSDLSANKSIDIIPHSGFLSFYLSNYGYDFFEEGKSFYEVRYYSNRDHLEIKTNPHVQVFSEIKCLLKSCKTYPHTPWKAASILEDGLKEVPSVLQNFREKEIIADDSILLGHATHDGLSYLSEQGINVIDELEEFIPFLFLKSLGTHVAEKPITFGDFDNVGLFIRKYDWVKGNFNNVAFGYYH